MLRTLTVVPFFLLFTDAAAAQSLAPMQREILTYADEAAVRVTLRNPYHQRRRFQVQVVNRDREPIRNARVSRSWMRIAPGGQTSLVVIVPMEGAQRRTFGVCALSETIYSLGTGVKGEVCGRYDVLRLSP